jgi:hypothetical protein
MRHQDQEAMEQETIRQDREEALRRLEGLGSPPAVFSEHGFRNFISEIDRAREDRRREALQKAQQQPPPPYPPFPEKEHYFIQAPLFPNLAAPQQVYLRGGAGEGTSLQDRRSEFWSSEAYVEEVEAQRAAEPSVPSTPSSKFGLVLTWLRDHIPAFLKKPTATPTQNGAAKNVQVGAALSQDHGREGEMQRQRRQRICSEGQAVD